MPVDALGRFLLLAGLVMAALGGVLLLAGRIPFLGRLPGDISVSTDNVHISIPLATSILVSVVLTLVLNLLGRKLF